MSSDDTDILQQVTATNSPTIKPWYSSFNSLQINTANSNKVSPLISSKRVSTSLSIKKNVTAPATITHIFKRMTRNPTIRATSSNVSKILRTKKGGQHHQQNQGVRIYMKSPHVVANGELAGTIILQSLHNNFSSIQLSLIGLEEIKNQQDQHYEFLNLEILNMTLNQIQSLNAAQNYMIEIPFLTTLSPYLGGSFENERASIKYHLKSEIKYNNNDKTFIISNTPVSIYPNFTSFSTNDFNSPIIENNKQVWKSTSSCVSMDLSLSRSVWMSGAPIYLTVKIHNNTIYTVCDMKLELVRKQNTFRLNEETIDSLSETISETSLSKLGWWCPLTSNRKDQLTLAVEVPSNQVTVHNQKLIDISFFIKMSILSSDRTDVVTEIPIILAHPIAMNPPPSLLSDNSQPLVNIPRITLCDDSQETPDILLNSPSTSLSDIDEVATPIEDKPLPPIVVDTCENDNLTSHPSPMSNYYDAKSKSVSMNNLPSIDHKSNSPAGIRFDPSVTLTGPQPLIVSTESIASSLHSTLDIVEPRSLSSFHSNNRQIRPLIRSYTTSSKKLNKMKRSLSSWGNLLSRKMSMSNINKRASNSRPEISSPIMSNYSISDEESIASSLHSSPVSNHDVIHIIHRNSMQPQRSIMKFGQIKGPKKFGQQPGSLGDAGLDIRKCFNVATVTEAIQSYAAEKVEIPDDIPFYFEEEEEYPLPVQLTENNNFKWKQGFIAPDEKCEFDMSMVDTTEEDTRRTSVSSSSKYPSFQQEGTTKRMLASSRHLQHLQRNGAQQQAQHSSVFPPSSV